MITMMVISHDPALPKRVKNLLNGEDILFTSPARNQAEAIKIIKENPPDLVLVDLFLPEHTGLDVIKNMEKMKLDASVILLTPVRNRAILERAMRTGARDIVVLPVSDEELVSVVLHRKRVIEDV